MLLAYSNGGFSFRSVAPDYVSQSGEVLFTQHASDSDLAAAFPGYAAAQAASLVSQLSGYAAALQARVLSRPISVNVAAQSSPPLLVLCDGTSDTRADLSMLAMWGQLNPTGTKSWLDNTGVTTVLTGAQLVTLALLVGNWIMDTYATLSTTIASIAAGTITTTAQIDAVTWPTS